MLERLSIKPVSFRQVLLYQFSTVLSVEVPMKVSNGTFIPSLHGEGSASGVSHRSTLPLSI
jgi:hypothetical protein